MMTRCAWAAGEPLFFDYHDREWGVPVHDDRVHFEFLILEGAQAGLSWRTVLQRRAGYARAFADFDVAAVADFDEARLAELLQDPGIIRNRAKVKAAIGNARAFLSLQREFHSFDEFLWRFVGGKTKVNRWTDMSQLPALSPESEAASGELCARGFRFVGPTIMYAHMQACGLINDHTVDCPRWATLAALAGEG